MFLLLLLLILADLSRGCPFYIKNGSVRTNYTNFDDTYTNSNKTMRVCDGATMESSIIISRDIEIIGDTDSCGLGAYFNISTATFTINGTAEVSFRSLRIIFNNTAITVTDNAVVSLTYVNLMFGDIGIKLSPALSNTAPFMGTNVMFQFLNVGLQLSRSMTIDCISCRFQTILTAGITTPSSDISLISLPQVVAQDDLILIGLRGSSNTLTAIQIPDATILCYEIAVCRSFAQVCNAAVVTQSETPVFGAGGGGGGTTKNGNNNNNNSSIRIGLTVALIVLVVMFGFICTMQTVKSRPKNIIN